MVGKIPKGLPSFTAPHFDSFKDFAHLLPTAAEIAFVSYVGNIALGKLFARKHGYAISSSMEMVSLGLCNLGTSFMPSSSLPSGPPDGNLGPVPVSSSGM